MTMGHEVTALYAMNSSTLWMIGMTPNQKLRTLDVVNNLEL